MNYLDDLPKVNPRTIMVKKAALEFGGMMLDLEKGAWKDLTVSEQLWIVADWMKSAMASCVQGEREKR